MPAPTALVLLSALALADDAGDALGKKVAAATGDVYAISGLTFTFVVEAGGTEKARRTHTWDRMAGTVVVTSGGTSTTLTGLHTTDPSPAVSDPAGHASLWSAVAPDATPEAGAKAWSAWINDSYWLLASGKVMDSGVTRSVDDQGRLVLTFDGVGLTPGDTYMLTVDPASHQVTAWDFELQGGNKAHFAWTDVQTFGPLTVSTKRSNEAGDFVIRFEDITVVP